MMFAQNLKYPFDHTVIYDVFEPDQVTSLINEAQFISEKYNRKDAIEMLTYDEHNLGVIEQYGTKVFVIDKVMPDGVIRNLCWNIPKLFFLNAIEKTYLTNYFHVVSNDKVYLQLYKNGDSYPNHNDSSTFSVVYVFYKNPKSNIDGGEFRFTDFNYKPYLLHNSCIIFPGWAKHEVTELKCAEDNFRISISQFLFQAFNDSVTTQTTKINLE